MSGKIYLISQPVLHHPLGRRKVGRMVSSWTSAVPMTGLEVVACGSGLWLGRAWPSIDLGQKTCGSGWASLVCEYTCYE